MKIRPLLLLLCLYTALRGEALVLVHLGKDVPAYVADCINQARLFNPTMPLYCIINKGASIPQQCLRIMNELDVKTVYAESLASTNAHREFTQRSRLDVSHRDGFWKKTSERFFYLHELMLQEHLVDAFHIENDVMLYINLSQSLEHFRNYKRIAAVFDNDERCIPSLMYFNNAESLGYLIDLFVQYADKGYTHSFDMIIPALFKRLNGSDYIDQLPIIMPDYAQDYPLESTMGHRTNHPENYWNHIDQFDSIFDAAALGQYLGGIDPRNGLSQPGFINESCLFNPSHLEFSWEFNDQGLRVPCAHYRGKKYRINNLHIHSKYLAPFTSKELHEKTVNN